jgi:hypothetical protein
MLRKVLISATVFGALAVASPALAGNYGGSTSSGWTSSGGCRYNCGSTSSTSSTSTSTTSTSSGTQVPEPGMIGLFGAGLIGLGAIQLRRRKALRK